MAGQGGKYLAVKVVLPRVSDKKDFAELDSVVVTDSTGGMTLLASKPARAAGIEASMRAGVEGHLAASFLPFDDKENASCKSIAEAEKLIEKKYKKWLENAYDWFVTNLASGGAASAKSAKKAKKKKAK